VKNEELWVPTKFESTKKGWRGSRNAANLAVSSRITADSAVRYYEAYLRRHCKGHILDLGCGTAPLYGIYRELASEVTCLDWDASYHGTVHADVHADLNEPMPLPDEAFDTILSTSVLEHVSRPDVAFDEIARILAPGGTAIIAVPFLYPIHEDPFDFYRYTKFALEEKCASRGLEIIEMDEFGGLAEVVCDLIAKVFRRRRVFGRILVACLQTFLRTTRIFRRKKRAIERFPLGYVLAARKQVEQGAD